MNEKERLIKAIEDTKKTVQSIDKQINEINGYLSKFDNVSIDELPMELQDSLIGLINSRNKLIRNRNEGQRLVEQTELLLKIGEQ